MGSQTRFAELDRDSYTGLPREHLRTAKLDLRRQFSLSLYGFGEVPVEKPRLRWLL